MYTLTSAESWWSQWGCNCIWSLLDMLPVKVTDIVCDDHHCSLFFSFSLCFLRLSHLFLVHWYVGGSEFFLLWGHLSIVFRSTYKYGEVLSTCAGMFLKISSTTNGTGGLKENICIRGTGMFLLLNTGVLTRLFRIYYSVCNSTGVIAVSEEGKLVQKYFQQGEKITLEHCILQCQLW